MATDKDEKPERMYNVSINALVRNVDAATAAIIEEKVREVLDPYDEDVFVTKNDASKAA